MLKPCPIIERKLPLYRYGQVAYDAIAEPAPAALRETIARMIFSQMLCFTYPPWLVEYRRVQSWKFALGVALGMRPHNLMGSYRFNLLTRTLVSVLYTTVTAIGLLIPSRLFQVVRPALYKLAKRSGERQSR